MMFMPRNTITLEEDLLQRLKAEASRTGQSFKDVVNKVIRRGLRPGHTSAKLLPFELHGARDLKGLPGLDYDNIAELTDYAEGPRHK